MYLIMRFEFFTELNVIYSLSSEWKNEITHDIVVSNDLNNVIRLLFYIRQLRDINWAFIRDLLKSSTIWYFVR